MDDRQRNLLKLLADDFDRQPMLDTATGEAFYPKLRADLIGAGATEADFQFLTEHLVRNVIERADLPSREAQQAQLRLIAEHFALRDFTTTVDRGVASVKFLSTIAKVEEVLKE